MHGRDIVKVRVVEEANVVARHLENADATGAVQAVGGDRYGVTQDGGAA